MNEGLLEELADVMGVTYLSDLRMPGYRRGLVQTLYGIYAENYSISKWRDAIQYLLGTATGSFRDAEEAKAYLIEHLNK